MVRPKMISGKKLIELQEKLFEYSTHKDLVCQFFFVLQKSISINQMTPVIAKSNNINRGKFINLTSFKRSVIYYLLATLPEMPLAVSRPNPPVSSFVYQLFAFLGVFSFE